MTARERSVEYAVMKTLGFRPRFIFALIAGESVAIALIGGVVAALLSFPTGQIFQSQLEAFLPIFEIEKATLVLMLAASVVIGLAAAVPPAVRACRMGIAEGLRHVG